MEECRSDFKLSTDKPTGKRNSGRLVHRYERNIISDLKEMSQYEELG